jgi:general secretion pathway protein I
MEVLLAISILLASLIVLGQMAYVGRQHAQSAEHIAQAQVICRSLMAELLAGARPVASSDWQTVPSVPGWRYAVELTPQEQQGLVAVSVTVERELPDEALDVPARRGKPFRLTRWMYRPGLTPDSAVELPSEFTWDAFE